MGTESKDKQKSLVQKFLSGKIDWRTFIITAGAFGGGYALSEFLPDLFRNVDKSKILSSGKKRILKEVLVHLFPAAEDSPGAEEINALTYLQFVLLDPQLDRRDQDFIVKGVQWLEEECQKLFATSFPELDSTQREQALREIEKEDWGERWISYLLKYTFEALLTDPIYGGNPNRIGWDWLSHVPGQPQPGEANKYGVEV